MTAKWPSSCLHAVSSTKLSRHGPNLLVVFRSSSAIRQYAQQPQRSSRPDEATSQELSQTYSAKAALDSITSGVEESDSINPPRSTLPPPLNLPERSQSQTLFAYYWGLGRAYGTFYKEGGRAVWYNYKAVIILRDRIKDKLGPGKEHEAALNGLITRAEWQLLQRNHHDLRKLPFFGLLLALFGEWLPLLVPFFPNAVPGTCRIPKQVRGMREKAEERRRISFRQGIEEPSNETLPVGDKEWAMAEAFNVGRMLQTLRNDHLLHLSATLGLHSRLWDRIQLPPPAFLLRRSISRHLRYLTVDDKALVAIEQVSNRLSLPELERACEERGLDILGRREALLRETLAWWLDRQKEDRGRGRAMLAMLFRRPNSWKPVFGDKE